jgi:hypothetical protein
MKGQLFLQLESSCCRARTCDEITLKYWTSMNPSNRSEASERKFHSGIPPSVRP